MSENLTIINAQLDVRELLVVELTQQYVVQWRHIFLHCLRSRARCLIVVRVTLLLSRLLLPLALANSSAILTLVVSIDWSFLHLLLRARQLTSLCIFTISYLMSEINHDTLRQHLLIELLVDDDHSSVWQEQESIQIFVAHLLSDLS